MLRLGCRRKKALLTLKALWKYIYFYDSREDMPALLVFFLSYFMIQGCLSTSKSGNLSSGLYRSSCVP
jgi:hypothetical protein